MSPMGSGLTLIHLRVDCKLRAGGWATLLRRVLGESRIMWIWFLTLSLFLYEDAQNNDQSSVHAKSEYPSSDSRPLSNAVHPTWRFALRRQTIKRRAACVLSGRAGDRTTDILFWMFHSREGAWETAVFFKRTGQGSWFTGYLYSALRVGIG
jgi:hypothetical protein